MVAELPSALVLQPQHAAAVVAELGDGEVEFAVAVQVARLHVGDAVQVVEDHVGRETLPAVVLQPDDLPDRLVAGIDAAQDRHHEVEVAVAVEIDGLDVAGGGQIDVAQHPLLPGAARRLAVPDDAAEHRVADEHVGEAVAVQIDDLHVRDERLARRLWAERRFRQRQRRGGESHPHRRGEFGDLAERRHVRQAEQ